MCQKFILQKERQVFIKCILRNVHNSYVFGHIGRRYCGRGTVTPSIILSQQNILPGVKTSITLNHMQVGVFEIEMFLFSMRKSLLYICRKVICRIEVFFHQISHPKIISIEVFLYLNIFVQAHVMKYYLV